MPVKAENKDEWKDLPLWVVLNPRRAAMFDDRELSGIYLTQWGGQDQDDNEIKHWGRVNKDNDCTRIRTALNAGILFVSNPRGESKFLPPPMVKAKNIDELMGKNTRDLISIVNQILTTDLLYKMKDWEEARPLKERRIMLIQEINGRLKSASVKGMTRIGSNPVMIKDKKTGKMVPDVVAIK